MQRHALGDAVGAAADRAGDMGAVSVAVIWGAAVDSVVAGADASAELGVAAANAGVDDVGVDPLPVGGIGVAVAER